MLVIVRRHFWLLGAAVVLACALLAYSGASQLVEANRLAPEPAYELPPMERAQPADAQPRDKTGDGLVARNMFCSDCAPPDPAVEAAPSPDGSIPLTDLPIDLLATSIASSPGASYATVRHSGSGAQGSYWLGDAVPGGGPIERIGGTNVIFHNPATRRLERISLLAESAAAAPAPEPATSERQPARRSSRNQFADRIESTGKSSYRVDADLVKELTANPMLAMRSGVRFAPAIEDGEPIGFRLSYSRPGSLADALGLQRGDTIREVNGIELTNPDALLDAFTKLRTQTNFRATVLRGGKPVTLTYDVR